ncbi:MAG: hypothetical protein ACLFRM_08030 [Guyparkeria sp.]|uniref:hypothetical protein n=1 Tax=Guyparkeria sp. TaxID=2035736 RepID=UPI00397883A4
MLDYFLSSDWAIIATELLAGFIVITLILAVLVWRAQRRHTGAAERLLDDRDPIVRASEEMVDRQIQRVWPELELDDEQRETYAERSLDAVEAMVEPWLDPKRYELATVARRFLQVRQADLEQLLTLARAHAEQNDRDDTRITALEADIEELRQIRDRQAKQLADSLETVNVMVREYGRKFDYNQEPHVATVLKAIVMVEEMEAGADCETAQRRAEEVFSEDLVATRTAPVEPEPEPTPAGDEASTDETAGKDTAAEATVLSPEEEMAAAMQAEASGTTPDDDAPATPPETAAEPKDASESAGEAIPSDAAATSEDRDRSSDMDASTDKTELASQMPAPTDADDIDQLIESAARAKSQAETPDKRADQPPEADTDASPAPQAASPGATTSGEPQDAGGDEPVDTATSGEGEPAMARNGQDTESKGDTETGGEKRSSHAERAERAERAEETENGVIDLDDVEIPKEDEKDKGDDKGEEFDLDDIDALLDAEIARKHGKDD